MTDVIRSWRNASRRAFHPGYEQSIRTEVIETGDALADALAAETAAREHAEKALSRQRMFCPECGAFIFPHAALSADGTETT